MARKDRVVQTVTFDLHTITPLILAGADQQEAELRVPSLRGALRYWLRALVGGMVGTDQEGLQKVATAEKNIFGATDSGSRVLVRIHHDELKPQPLQREGYNIHTATGKDYLLWSALGRRPCIPPDASFQVTFAIRQYDREEGEAALQQALCAFWLLIQLGGIGSRSRRCAGSLAVASSSGETFALPFSAPTSAQALRGQLKQGIAQSRACYKSLRREVQAQPSFDILHPKFCHIWVLCSDGQPWTNIDQALRDIGDKLRTCRSSITNMEDRKYFGLPIMVTEQISAGSRTVTRSHPYPIKGVGKGFPRLASPLHLHLAELHTPHGKEYACVAMLFKTWWKGMSPDDYNQYSLIEEWIKQDFPGTDALEWR
jgi:CRISPR-associated protein Cmr1